MSEILQLWSDYGTSITTILLSITVIILLRGKIKISAKGIDISRDTDRDGLLLAFDKDTEAQSKIMGIKLKDRLADQTQYYDDKKCAIRERLIQKYRHLLLNKLKSIMDAKKEAYHKFYAKNSIEKQKKQMIGREIIRYKHMIEGIHDINELKCYSNIIELLIEVRLRDLFIDKFELMQSKFFYVENDDCSFDFIRNEFEKYAQMVVMKLFEESKKYITDKWIDSEFLTKREVFLNLQEKEDIKYIYAEMYDILYYAVKCQLKCDRQIKLLREQKRKYIEEKAKIRINQDENNE